jgi:hypothetical protein
MSSANNLFQNSPLITPTRLDEDVTSALRLRPDWATTFAIVNENETAGESAQLATVLHASSQSDDKPISLTATQAAILFELTRFGGSVDTDNANEKAYPKLLGRKREDNVTVRRIWADADANEDIALAAGNESQRHEHRVGEAPVHSRGSGRAHKNARQVVLDDALARAVESAAPVFSVATYMANLGALFHRLDGMQPK